MKTFALSSYLNTQPIAYAFQKNLLEYPFKLDYALPHDCAIKLKNGEYQAALIPSIELARANDDYVILDTFCISSKNYVKSVELFFNQNLETINTVALDKTSRTSAILTKIILEEKFGIYPTYIEMDADLDEMLKVADAALIIGDKALDYHDKRPNKLDLCEEWYDLTELPFVFAVFAGFEFEFNSSIAEIFRQALELGEKNLDTICKEWQENHSTESVEFYKDYLTQNINFHFGEEEKEALETFFDYAFLKNYIDYMPEIKYFSSVNSEKK